ncbi:MAG TPA: alpha/beta fold hydrolase [Candidatus Binatia bacterium]|nr:alpha/beta fold hydrolase [Candidatus Binatia bacterium]
MRLHYEVQGDGHPLVILHGFLGSSENWRAMRKLFATTYKVFSVDQRNHGSSPHSSTMNYGVMTEDLRGFLSEQGLSKAFLLGHSMGGKVAMQFASQSPQAIEKLVIVDVAPKAYPPAHRLLLQAMQNLELRGLKTYGEAEAALGATISDARLRKFVVKNLTRDRNGEFQWRIGLDSLAANYDQLLKAPAMLNSFEKPTCFIRGGLSRFIDDQDFAAIRKHFALAEFHTVQDAGHWVHIDAPEEFYRIVDEYLRLVG